MIDEERFVKDKDTRENQQKQEEKQDVAGKSVFPFIEMLPIEDDLNGIDATEVYREF